MCYKIEVQNKNAEKLNRKLDELNLPIYMRKYFTVKIDSKAGVELSWSYCRFTQLVY